VDSSWARFLWGVEALGLQVSTTNGRQALEHSGVIDRFTAHLAYYPQDKLTVVVLGNVQGAEVQQIARRLAIVAHGGQVTLPGEKKVIHVDGDVLDRYTGVYRLPSGDLVVIQRKGEHTTAPQQKAAQLILHQGGPDLVAIRISDAEARRILDSLKITEIESSPPVFKHNQHYQSEISDFIEYY
jgi:hypothetical protein